jgi:phosphoglycolate phosphatase-like HAD superfamily hydrolase
VLDKETGVTKSAHLEHLHGKFGSDYPDMCFIDDKVNHLDDVARLGVRCALATWGFNGPRETALARAAGHLVCTLDDVEAQIFA